jgi:hypothetical protein
MAMSRGDIRHLKQYVKSHPDNQMAWYLLGKHYESENKTGKAMYCFLKSRDVYEAFEKKSLPDLLPEDQDPLSDHGALSLQLPGRWRRRSALALLLLTLMFFRVEPERLDPERPAPGLAAGEPAIENDYEYAVDGAPGELTAGGTDGGDRRPRAPFRMIYALDRQQAERETLRNILGEVPMAEETVLARAAATDDGKWILWTESPAYVLSAHRFADGRLARLEYYDPSVCGCVPADPAPAAARFADWQAEAEQLVVALSALAQYRSIHGENPGGMADIVRPYPNNLLSGYTPLMESVLMEQLARDGEETAADAPASASPADPPADDAGSGLDGWMREPLEIIVDPANHRLALVAGPVILRNYPVGLGGEKTPRGQFIITEKVRNPNGRADGDFGSRGMTLSDTLYAIHGTNEPESIGQDWSNGCVRMLNEDIEELFDMTPLGTRVTIAEGVLPSEISRSASRFHVPARVDDTNPNKVYRWLN